MRFAVLLSMMVSTPAFACNSDVLTVLEWTATKNENSRSLPVLLEAKVQYQGDHAFRMIHAGVMFSDVLGQSLGQVNLDRDRPAKPGETLVADGQTGAKERILTLNRDDIVYRTCVWSIVYDDGTKEEFK